MQPKIALWNCSLRPDKHHFGRVKTLAIFVYGFPKSAKANLNALELDAYKKLAQVFLGFSDQDIAEALNAGELMEVSGIDARQVRR